MGLKEILAAKKAAAEKEANETKTTEVSNSIAPSSTTIVGAENASGQDITNATKQEVPVSSGSNDQSTEALVDANGKPLSGFALVKRRKELAAQAALAPVKEEAKKEEAVGIPAEPFNAQFILKTQEPIVELQHVPTDEIAHEAYAKATPETKQAYVDLKERIDNLCNLQDTDLKNAMTELKKALMQNTNAVALMLPSDIGQMVIALRKMTGVELAKAEEKKTGRKVSKKEATLTAEELEEAFKEL